MAISLGYRFRSNNVSGYDFGSLSVDDGFVVARRLLKRTMENLFLMRLGVKDQIQHNNGLTIGWDRLEHLPLVTTAIVEGETPDFSQIDRQSVRKTVNQYGDWIPTTDVMDLALGSDWLSGMMDLQADQIKRTLETLVFYVVRAGTSVSYSRSTGSTGRTDVNRTIAGTKGITASSPGTANGNFVDLIIRSLEANDAGKIKKMIGPTDNVSTTPVARSFCAVCSPDLIQDIYQLPLFTPVEQYSAQIDVMPEEIGKYKQVRFVATNILDPWEDAGAAITTDKLLSTTGVLNDVYPVLFFADEAFGIVNMQGYTSVTPKYAKAKVQPGSDPLGQRGSCGWMTWFAAAILNDNFLYRGEVGCSSLA